MTCSKYICIYSRSIQCIFFNNFIYSFIFGSAGSLLLCWLFSGGEWECLSSGSVWASRCGGTGSRGQGLQQLWCVNSVIVAPRLQSTGSIAVAHGLSHSGSCGIFPDQGLNSCLLHWQTDSLPLSNQGSPDIVFLKRVQLFCS